MAPDSALQGPKPPPATAAPDGQTCQAMFPTSTHSGPPRHSSRSLQVAATLTVTLATLVMNPAARFHRQDHGRQPAVGDRYEWSPR